MIFLPIISQKFAAYASFVFIWIIVSYYKITIQITEKSQLELALEQTKLILAYITSQ